MATFQTAFAQGQAQRSYLRGVNPDFSPVQMTEKVARFDYPLTGNEANGDIITLGSLALSNALIDAAASKVCAVIVGSAGSPVFNGNLKLQTVDNTTNPGSPSASDATGSVTVNTGGTAIAAFTNPTSVLPKTLQPADQIQAVITSLTSNTVPAGDTVTLSFFVKYYTPDLSLA